MEIKGEENRSRIDILEGKNLDGVQLQDLMKIKADLMSSLCQLDY
jgi:hypothetical protein